MDKLNKENCAHDNKIELVTTTANFHFFDDYSLFSKHLSRPLNSANEQSEWKVTYVDV